MKQQHPFWIAGKKRGAKKRRTTGWALAAVLFLLGLEAAWGGMLFSRSEYADRRERFMDKIPDGVAVIWGAAPDQTGGKGLTLQWIRRSKYYPAVLP